MKYLKPKISSKKIKLNFFLTNITPLDRFTIIGDVYAGSGDCACGGGGGGNSNSAGACGCGVSTNPDSSVNINSSCNSACASNSGARTTIPVAGGFHPTTQNQSCSSNSNCGTCKGGCNCNSVGGACNSGSGGGSGNSGSGSCNSGG